MTIAKFFLVIEDRRIELEGGIPRLAQEEVLKTVYSLEDLLLNSQEIFTLYATPVFDDRDANGPNLGPWGEKSIRKREWIAHGEPYILRV